MAKFRQIWSHWRRWRLRLISAQVVYFLENFDVGFFVKSLHELVKEIDETLFTPSLPNIVLVTSHYPNEALIAQIQ